MSGTPSPRLTVTAELVRQLAAANGLWLTPERAESLVPALQAILDTDVAIAAMPINTLPMVGAPWEGSSTELKTMPEIESGD